VVESAFCFVPTTVSPGGGAKVRIRLSSVLIVAVLLAVASSVVPQLPALAQTESPEPAACSEDSLWQPETITTTLFTSLTPTVTLGPAVTQTISLTVEETDPDSLPSTDPAALESGSGDLVTLLGVPMEVMEWEEAQVREAGARLAGNYDYPTRLDWRDLDGNNWTTRVRNQSTCGACVAFATIGAIESRLEIALLDPTLDPDLSEAHLFFCDADSSCVTGWSPYAALNSARDIGIADEACYPYSTSDQTCSVCPDWQNRVTSITDWVGLTNSSDMKQALADEGPFEATMLVYSDFFSYTAGVYRHTSGALEGGHAVTVVGYDDEEGYWIAKNGWGGGWGENGWFKIAYGECGIDDYAYVPIVEVPLPSYHLYPSVAPTGGGTIVSEPLACIVGGCESGTQVMLTAVAVDGYEFAGWDGDVSGDSESISVIVDSDKTVTARFVLSTDGLDLRAFVPFVTG
jgi:C1A family cysteine protease